jgi:hypothetical protein
MNLEVLTLAVVLPLVVALALGAFAPLAVKG